MDRRRGRLLERCLLLAIGLPVVVILLAASHLMKNLTCDKETWEGCTNRRQTVYGLAATALLIVEIIAWGLGTRRLLWLLTPNRWRSDEPPRP